MARQSFASLEAKLDHFSAPFVSGQCREWLRAKDTNGYGRISFNGEVIPAHRAAWIVEHGPIPPGLNVLHSCDNRGCINAQEHLWLGTQAENMADMAKKGRAPNRKKP